MPTRRRQMTPRKKNLAIRDGEECWFCGAKLRKDQLTVEHLLSVINGGTNHMDNLVLACPPCNHDVGHRSIAKKVEFREQKRKEIHVTIQKI